MKLTVRHSTLDSSDFYVFALSSDWFSALSAFVVIGQSDFFGFGFMNQSLQSFVGNCSSACTAVGHD